MKSKLKLLIVVCVLAGLIGWRFRIDRKFHKWTDWKFHQAMTANYEFKRGHVAPGTLKSISAAEINTTVEDDNSRTYTVCFTIDSFPDVPRDLQSEYAQAERERMAKDGPRCIRARSQRPIDGRPEEAIRVYYLIYGHGAITVERLTIQGGELNAM